MTVPVFHCHGDSVAPPSKSLTQSAAGTPSQPLRVSHSPGQNCHQIELAAAQALRPASLGARSHESRWTTCGRAQATTPVAAVPGRRRVLRLAAAAAVTVERPLRLAGGAAEPPPRDSESESDSDLEPGPRSAARFAESYGRFSRSEFAAANTVPVTRRSRSPGHCPTVSRGLESTVTRTPSRRRVAL